MQHLLADMTGPHAAMALAHLAAVAVIGLWLAVDERMLWTIVVLARDHTRALVGETLLAYRALAQSVADTTAVSPYLQGLRWQQRTEHAPPRQATPRPLSRRGPPAARLA